MFRVQLTIFISLFWMAAPTAAAPISKQQIGQIRSLVEARMKAANIPGASVAIGIGNEIVWSGGFGLADVENNVPATPESAYRTASIGKAMTATVAMQLAEQGRLDLNAPVQRYCPRFPAKAQQITVRELITHTSGIRHYEGPTAADEAYISRHYDRVSDAVEIFANDPLTQMPGDDFHYTTWGYVVLGCVLEGASGQEFRLLMKALLFDPAKMHASRDDDPRVIISNRASGYNFSDGKLTNAPFSDMSAKMAAGGFITTAPDLVRFMNRWMMNGYVSPATQTLMLTPYSLPNGNGTVDGFGMGWFLDDFRGHRAGIYGGSTAGVSGFIFFVPALRLSIAGLFNLEDFPAAERGKLIKAIATIAIPPAKR